MAVERAEVWAPRFRGGLALVLAVALAACGSDEPEDGEADAGIDGTGGTGGAGGSFITGGTSGGGAAGQTGGAGGAACGDLGRSAACTACLDERCCSEHAACSASAGCVALVGCARECPETAGSPDETCLQDCLSANPDDFASYNLLVLCQGNDCPAECPFATP